MRTMILGLFMLICAAGNAQSSTKNSSDMNTNTSSYCMQVKGDNLILTKDGKQIYTDIKLDNGTIISANGRILRTDGTEKLLHENECADLNGEILKPVVDKK